MQTAGNQNSQTESNTTTNVIDFKPKSKTKNYHPSSNCKENVN
jgi:hypothetical protein